MLDEVARWLLRLCLTCSMCACAQWLMCRALAYEASFMTSSSSSFVVFVAIVTVQRRDMNMLCTCAQGLVVRHLAFVIADCCCRRRRYATLCKNAVHTHMMRPRS
jgi:hypothetical protein